MNTAGRDRDAPRERLDAFRACFETSPLACGVVEIGTGRARDALPVFRYANDAMKALLNLRRDMRFPDLPAPLSGGWAGFFAEAASGVQTRRTVVAGRRVQLRAWALDVALLAVSAEPADDTAEARRLVEALAVSETRDRLLMERTGMILFDYDKASGTFFCRLRLDDGTLADRAIPRFADWVAQSGAIAPESVDAARDLLLSDDAAILSGTLELRADIARRGVRWMRVSYDCITNAEGRATNIVGQLEDIQRQKEREALVARFNTKLRTRAVAQSPNDSLIERVFLTLYQAHNVGETIHSILETLGAYYGVSRAFIYEDSEDHRTFSNTFEWCAEGVAPLRASRKRLAYADCPDGLFSPDPEPSGVFLSLDTSDLPAAWQARMRAEGVRATLRCAILDDGVFAGFIGFDDHSPDARWTDEQISTLTMVSRLTGAFLMKKRKSDAAADKRPFVYTPDFGALIERLPGGICALRVTDAGRTLYVNDAYARMLGYTREEVRVALAHDSAHYICAEDKPRARAAFEEVTAGRTDWMDVTLRVNHRDGKPRHLRYQTSAIGRDAEGATLLTLFTDVTARLEAERALRLRGEEYRIVVRQSGKQVLRYDVRTHEAQLYDSASSDLLGRQATVLTRYPWSFVEAGGVARESVDAFLRFYEAIRRGEPQGFCDARMRDANGVFRWMRADYTLVRDAAGAPSHAIVSFFDNTERHERELAFASWQKALSALLETNTVYAEFNLTRDEIGRAEGETNPFRGMPGSVPLSAAARRAVGERLHPDDAAAWARFFDRERLLSLFYGGAAEDALEARILLAGGQSRWFHANLRMTRAPSADDVMAFVIFTDIDERRRELERASEDASCDALTGLLSREAVERRASEALETMPPASSGAIFLIQTGDIKRLNDTLGYQAGEAAILRASNLIQKIFRASDIVGRANGDTFIAWMGGATRAVVRRKASMLMESLTAAAEGGERARLTASIGVARGHGGTPFPTLCRLADAALFTARSFGRNRYHILELLEADAEDSREGAGN